MAMISLPERQAEALSEAADREADARRLEHYARQPGGVHYLHGVRDAFLPLRGVIDPHSDKAPEELREAYQRYLDSV